MADLKVEVVKIDDIQNHPNADRLDLATVFGYTVVVGRDEYEAGDLSVYFPVDSILPVELQDCIFAGSKMKLSKNRVRAAKIRGAMSQGLLVSQAKIKEYLNLPVGALKWNEGRDLTDELNVTKFEPPVKTHPTATRKNEKPQKYNNPRFKRYTKIQHLRRYNKAFEDGERVIISEKIHGTNFRAGWVKRDPRNFLDKIRMLFPNCRWGLGKWEFVFGSHNVQLQSSRAHRANAAHGNVYERVTTRYDLRNNIPKGMVWYGEIYGPGIQSGYDYGLEEPTVKFFDVWSDIENRYLDFDEALRFIHYAGFYMPKSIDTTYNLETISTFLNESGGLNSWMEPNTKMEGFVVRSFRESQYMGMRRVYKMISDAYLLDKTNTDNH